MRTKVTLALVFLNVALFVYIFKFERSRDPIDPQTSSVLGPEAANIRTLRVTSTAPGASFTLERRRDSWFLTQPFEWPANLHAASAIVHDLQLLRHESVFKVADLAKNGLSLADYGLDKPRLTVAFSSVDPAARVSALKSSQRSARQLASVAWSEHTEATSERRQSRMKPRDLPVSGSCGSRARKSASSDTQCGGYLKRATSRIST